LKIKQSNEIANYVPANIFNLIGLLAPDDNKATVKYAEK